MSLAYYPQKGKIAKVYIVQCGVEHCGRKVQLNGGVLNVERSARIEGWGVLKGQWVCPFHKPRTNKRPVEVFDRARLKENFEAVPQDEETPALILSAGTMVDILQVYDTVAACALSAAIGIRLTYFIPYTNLERMVRRLK